VYAENFFQWSFLSVMGINLDNRLLVERGIHQGEFCEIVRMVDRKIKKKETEYISSYFGRIRIQRDNRMKNVVPEKVLKEIFQRKLKRRDLTGQVYNKLKQMILSGKLKRGERLVQEELALRFNVSRQTIIFALRQLKKDKLIVVKYKKGAFVS
jgi:DNA-binding XRE family transcriptional regulator